MDPHTLARWVHVGSGFAAVALGLVVMLVPKFGRRRSWHRRLGQIYAALIGTSAVVGIPLSYLRGSTYLMTLGAITAVVIGVGWRDAVLARRAMRTGNLPLAERHLRWHLILMGASYIGAWSGFFANNFVFGTDAEWKLWFYAVGPSLIGAPFIAVAARRVRIAAADKQKPPGSVTPPAAGRAAGDTHPAAVTCPSSSRPSSPA
jgi:uncharacterized membrane protein